MLYEWLDYLSKNEVSELDIKKTIDKYILIEGKNKNEIKDIRDIVNFNSSMLFKGFNETIINMNEIKDRLDYYSDKDVAEIFGKTEATIKTWRKNGRLKYEQKQKGCKVRISKSSIDMFVRENPEHKRRWEINKK